MALCRPMMAPHLAPIGTGYIALTVLVINVVAAFAGRYTPGNGPGDHDSDRDNLMSRAQRRPTSAPLAELGATRWSGPDEVDGRSNGSGGLDRGHGNDKCNRA